jgi:hypothetical protein
LVNKGAERLSRTGIELEMIPTLWGHEDISANGKEYVSEHDDLDAYIKQFLTPLVELFAKERLLELIESDPELLKLKDEPIFQKLVEQGTYYNETTDQCIELTYHFRTKEEGNIGTLDDIIMTKEHGENIQIGWSFTIGEYDLYDIYIWHDDKTMRLPILLGTKKNPNEYAISGLTQCIEKEKAVTRLEQTDHYSKHYSNIEKKEYAFEIKVYENFLPAGWLDLGILSYMDESLNREQALTDLCEELRSECDFQFVGTRGRSGGYAVFTCDELCVEKVEKADKIITEAIKSSYKQYQDIRYYEHVFDEISSHILDQLDEKNEEKMLQVLQDIQKIKEEN